MFKGIKRYDLDQKNIYVSIEKAYSLKSEVKKNIEKIEKFQNELREATGYNNTAKDTLAKLKKHVCGGFAKLVLECANGTQQAIKSSDTKDQDLDQAVKNFSEVNNKLQTLEEFAINERRYFKFLDCHDLEAKTKNLKEKIYNIVEEYNNLVDLLTNKNFEKIGKLIKNILPLFGEVDESIDSMKGDVGYQFGNLKAKKPDPNRCDKLLNFSNQLEIKIKVLERYKSFIQEWKEQIQSLNSAPEPERKSFLRKTIDWIIEHKKTILTAATVLLTVVSAVFPALIPIAVSSAVATAATSVLT